MKQHSPEEATAERRLSSILQRIALGDTSVTDLVYWLQMQDDASSERPETPPSGRTTPPDPSA